MSADAFDGVLPQRRGSQRDETAASSSPLERARLLVAAVEAHQGALTDMVVLERRLARDLGLSLTPGYWTTPMHDREHWALCAIYDADEFVGFVDLGGDAACGLLRLDKPGVSLLAAVTDGRA